MRCLFEGGAYSSNYCNCQLKSLLHLGQNFFIFGTSLHLRPSTYVIGDSKFRTKGTHSPVWACRPNTPCPQASKHKLCGNTRRNSVVFSKRWFEKYYQVIQFRENVCKNRAKSKFRGHSQKIIFAHILSIDRHKSVTKRGVVCSVGCLWHSQGKNPVRLYPKLQSQPIGLPKIFID